MKLKRLIEDIKSSNDKQYKDMPDVKYRDKDGNEHSVKFSTALSYGVSDKKHPAYLAAKQILAKNKPADKSTELSKEKSTAVFSDKPQPGKAQIPGHSDPKTIAPALGKGSDKLTGPSTPNDAISNNPRHEQRIVNAIQKLAKQSAEAKKEGKKIPDYNLCKITVPGTNLFCSGNKGIPRQEMPQLKGKPVSGSPADKMKKSASGEVDIEDAFKQHLKANGVKLVKKSVPVTTLKATQNELVGAKVAGMIEALKNLPPEETKGITAPIFVSKDGYILDGHHRWAAMVGLDVADGGGPSVNMNVIEVDMDAMDLVKATNDFANEMGIAQKAGKVKESLQFAKIIFSMYEQLINKS